MYRNIYAVNSVYRHEKNKACREGNGDWLITLSENWGEGVVINQSINGNETDFKDP